MKERRLVRVADCWVVSMNSSSFWKAASTRKATDANKPWGGFIQRCAETALACQTDPSRLVGREKCYARLAACE